MGSHRSCLVIIKITMNSSVTRQSFHAFPKATDGVQYNIITWLLYANHIVMNKDIERAKATDINEAVKRLVNRDEALVRENANKDSNVYSTQRDLLEIGRASCRERV